MLIFRYQGYKNIVQLKNGDPFCWENFNSFLSHKKNTLYMNFIYYLTAQLKNPKQNYKISQIFTNIK
jgi:hypothetical protein